MEPDNDYCKIHVPTMSDTDQVTTWFIKDFGLPDRTDLTRENYNKSKEVSEMILTLQSPKQIILEKTLPKAPTKRSKTEVLLIDQIAMGSGLPDPIKRTHHSKAVKNFVEDCFERGFHEKHMKLADVVNLMWKALDENGEMMYPEPKKESQVCLSLCNYFKNTFSQS